MSARPRVTENSHSSCSAQCCRPLPLPVQARPVRASTACARPRVSSIQVFHDGIGQRARHLVVRDNGDVFVARRDGALFALRDTDGDGQADLTEERALPISTGLEYQPPLSVLQR